MSALGYLLDTNVMFWADQEPQRLSERVRALLSEREQNIVCSVASVWELAIKQSLGKLVLNAEVAKLPGGYGWRVLPIELQHIAAASRLPLHHRDPLDRILVAQAQTEGLVLITADRRLEQYDVALLRC